MVGQKSFLEVLTADYGDEEGQTDSDQDVRSGIGMKPYTNEIMAHVGGRDCLEKSFDARGSFVHFSRHSMGDVAQSGHNFMEPGSARSFMGMRLSWYASDGATRLRGIAQSRSFTALSMLSVFVALFFSDLFVLFQVPTNTELDVILSCAFAFFVVEIITLCLCEASYPLSFFCWMDLVGTMSMIFDISYLLGPDATLAENDSTSSGSGGHVIIARAARTARLAARAGRLSRVAKILRFLNTGSSEVDDSKGKMSKSVSSKLADVLSIRIAFLTICVAVILPSVKLMEYPEMDESTIAWTQLLAADSTEYYDSRGLSRGSSAALVVTGRKLHKEIRHFVLFYEQASYGPFLACLGQLRRSSAGYDCVGAPGVGLELNSSFAMPRRRSSILQMSEGGLRVLFDMSTPQRVEAATNVALLFFVIITMIVAVLTVSAQISAIALTPLERMLYVVRSRCKPIFKYTDTFASLDREDDDEAEVQSGAGEYELLEKAVSKLAAIVHLLATKTEPEVTDEMTENDFMVLHWTQGRLDGGGGLGVGRMRGWSRASSDQGSVTLSSIPLTESWLGEDGTSPVLRRVHPDVAESLRAADFDALAMPDNTKQPIAAYIIYYLDTNAGYTQTIVSEQCVINFVNCAAKGYLLNPFHNFSHAVDVLYMLSRSCRQIEALNFLHEDAQYWLLIAAMGHDLGHLAVSNQYLIESSHELAVMYNDISPLENMHCSKLFEILSNIDANVLAGLSKDDYKEARTGIIAAILHTDVTKHNEMVKELNLLYQLNSDIFGFGSLDEREAADDVLRGRRQMVANALLHCADIGNPMKPWTLCHKYAELCMAEFFAQGDSEKELAIPVGMLNDREKINMPNSQIGFIEFMVAPFAEAMVLILPQLDELGLTLADNLKHWFQTWVEQASPTDDAVERVQARIDKTVSRLESASTMHAVD